MARLKVDLESLAVVVVVVNEVVEVEVTAVVVVAADSPLVA